MHHVRRHGSLLANAERRLLVAIARRLPSAIDSDHLTLLGLAAMLAAGGAFAFVPAQKWGSAAVAAALAVNWFGDSLDGTLARVRDRQRPRYGYYVDHAIDLAGTIALAAGMAASGLMHVAVAAAFVAAYFLVMAETFLATHAGGVFRLSFAGIGPTELRILLAGGTFYVASHPWVHIADRRLLLLDAAGAIAAAALVGVFIVSAVRTARDLARVERLPAHGAERAA
jgi:phosphatidylglycerophosphate synthase